MKNIYLKTYSVCIVFDRATWNLAQGGPHLTITCPSQPWKKWIFEIFNFTVFIH